MLLVSTVSSGKCKGAHCLGFNSNNWVTYMNLVPQSLISDLALSDFEGDSLRNL